MVNVVAVILAAGEGRRLKVGEPKAIIEVKGQSILEWCLISLARWPRWTNWVIVLHPSILDWFETRVRRRFSFSWDIQVTIGGKERADSTRNGLKLIASAGDESIVMVHDCARPLVPPGVLQRLYEGVLTTGSGVIPVVPIPDTIKRVRNNRVVETLNRHELVRSQTPQAYPLHLLRKAIDLENEGVTDEAMWLEKLGYPVYTVPGHEDMRKITYPEDLQWLAWRLETQPLNEPSGGG